MGTLKGLIYLTLIALIMLAIQNMWPNVLQSASSTLNMLIENFSFPEKESQSTTLIAGSSNSNIIEISSQEIINSSIDLNTAQEILQDNARKIDRLIEETQQKVKVESKNNDSGLVITYSAPEGFEDLLEEQLTFVDVYYSGKLIGRSLARYNTETIQLDDAENIVNNLEYIKNKNEIITLLQAPLPINSANVCFYEGQANCGVLYPEFLGVIFDETNLRVDLFINPELLTKKNIEVSRYLPPSTSNAAMINQISVVASGGDQTPDLYTGRINSIISNKNYRFNILLESDQDNGSRVDQASVIYEEKDLEYQLGTFRTRTQNTHFFQQQDFIGFRVQSSLAMRTDLEQVSGSRIFVFLNERSRVDVLLDGQLIESRIYPAGNIELDTRNFPQGSYTVDVKITGDSGQITTEQHIYSKSLSLPPLNESLFYFELGYPESPIIEDKPVANEHHIARFGYINRINESLGLSGVLSKSYNQNSLELGGLWIGKNYELQTNHAFNSEDEYGNYLLMRYQNKRINLSASFYETKSGNLPLLDESYRLIPLSKKQTQINLGVPLDRAFVNLYHREFEQLNFADNRKTGISWRQNIYRSGKILVDWTLDASRGEYDKQIMAGITLRLLSQKYNMDMQLARDSYRNELQGIEEDYWNKTLRLQHRYQGNSIGKINSHLELNEIRNKQNITAQSEIENDYGYARLAVNQSRNTDGLTQINNFTEKQNTYSMAAYMNLVSTDSEIAVGGNRQNLAGVLIDVSNFKNEELSFAVIVDGIERTIVESGNKTFISLPPYKSYQISIAAIGETLVDFDDALRNVTLYPGNVEKLKWDIDQVYVIVMQLMHEHSEGIIQPFANAKLQSDDSYGRTDDLGWIQMEIKGVGELIFKNAKDETCKVSINRDHIRESVNYIGPISCQ